MSYLRHVSMIVSIPIATVTISWNEELSEKEKNMLNKYVFSIIGDHVSVRLQNQCSVENDIY